MKEVLAIFLAVLFVVSLTAVAVRQVMVAVVMVAAKIMPEAPVKIMQAQEIIR